MRSGHCVWTARGGSPHRKVSRYNDDWLKAGSCLHMAIPTQPSNSLPHRCLPSHGVSTFFPACPILRDLSEDVCGEMVGATGYRFMLSVRDERQTALVGTLSRISVPHVMVASAFGARARNLEISVRHLVESRPSLLLRVFDGTPVSAGLTSNSLAFQAIVLRDEDGLTAARVASSPHPLTASTIPGF